HSALPLPSREAAKSPGYVRAVPVNDFQKVRAGDLLVDGNAEAAIELIQQQKTLQEAFIKQAEATIRRRCLPPPTR
ncbi:MAG TPA: hypothetical protein VF783_16605, partial [Terriglobales bacterium]